MLKLATIVCVIAIHTLASGADSVSEWMAQLSSDSFAAREDAESHLNTSPWQSTLPIVESTQIIDPEAQLRIARIVGKLRVRKYIDTYGDPLTIWNKAIELAGRGNRDEAALAFETLANWAAVEPPPGLSVNARACLEAVTAARKCPGYTPLKFADAMAGLAKLKAGAQVELNIHDIREFVTIIDDGGGPITLAGRPRIVNRARLGSEPGTPSGDIVDFNQALINIYHGPESAVDESGGKLILMAAPEISATTEKMLALWRAQPVWAK